MCRKEVFHLRPLGYETSQEESFRLSILDMVVPPNYNTYAIVFKLDDSGLEDVVDTFKRGIEMTLQQCRHLAGTIQKNKHQDYSIVKTPENTVDLVVQWLDAAEDDFPSHDDLEAANFTLRSMRDPGILGIAGMPDSCHPDDNPAVVAFQLNLIPGGFIFTMHVHHFALDMSGTASVIQQLAENCNAVAKKTAQPAWDDNLLDRSRFIAPPVPLEDQCDPPPRPPRHPDWQACSWFLFHLSPAAAVRLKALAQPQDGTRISTYDAVTALCWRIIARNRARIYGADLTAPAIFGQPMNMRERCEPKLPARYQGNALAAGLSFQQKSPLLLGEVISEARLSQIAAFVRSITSSVGQRTIDETIAKVAPIRVKAELDMPLDSLPPLSFTTTDWRYARLADNDFGVGRATAYRCLYKAVVENMMILYPPHKGSKTGEQGIEVMLPFESSAIELLLEDADVKEFFEFRSVEVN